MQAERLSDASKDLIFSDGGISVWRMNRADISDELYEHLCSLTQNGFSREDDDELRDDIEHHVNGTERFYVAIDDHRDYVFGYFLVNVYEHSLGTILYLSGAMIHESYQGRGVTRDFVCALAANIGAKYVVARTQNPIMYKSVRNMCRMTYPCFDSFIYPPEDVKEIADFVSAKKGRNDYNRDTLIDRGTYNGKPLYGDLPRHDNHWLNAWFNGQLDASNGDSMMVVGLI